MKLHHKILNLFMARYSSLRFFPTIAGQKTLHYFRHIFHVYFARLEKELLVILPIFLFLIFLGNIIQPQSQFEIAKLNILDNPSDPKPHEFLAQQFFVTNQYVQAEKEAEIANDPSLIKKFQGINKQPEVVKTEIINLQNVIAQFPAYRDAYIKLAILNWKLYRPFIAEKYLQNVLEIDPNNEVARKLSSLQ